jgi:hypothetical protein
MLRGFNQSSWMVSFKRDSALHVVPQSYISQQWSDWYILYSIKETRQHNHLHGDGFEIVMLILCWIRLNGRWEIDRCVSKEVLWTRSVGHASPFHCWRGFGFFGSQIFWIPIRIFFSLLESVLTKILTMMGTNKPRNEHALCSLLVTSSLSPVTTTVCLACLSLSLLRKQK